MSKKIIKRIYNVVIILLFLGAIGWCFSHFYHGSDVAYTDDAQVNRHITPINTRVPGFIKEIRFNDYQHVKKGDTLVIIEDAEFRLHVAQAEAGLRGSKSSSSVVTASMGTTNTNVQTAAAGIEEARVDMMNAKQDFDRFAALMKKDAVTRQQYDNAYARYQGAKARYEQASSRKASLSALLPTELRQRHLLLHAHRVSGRTDAVPALLHGIDDGRHHPQRSDVSDVFRSVQFRTPLSDGRQHVARLALRCHQSSDAQHPESLWHHLSHRYCRADHLPALGCTAREKYPEEDAILELRGKENEEKERICEIKPIIITAVSFL